MARVLLAEDDDGARTQLKRALAKDGHDVVDASDGGEALSALQAAPASFDLLLADIKMPVMDGIALALAAVRDAPDLPIILMSGYADQRARASNLSTLVRDVITKPFTLAELRGSIARALAPSHSPDTIAN